MPPRLIVNADDFGLTSGINRAVGELHRAGALTSATLMANGPAFADAVAIAHQNPTLGVGCHLVFTDGTSVSDPGSIPSLVVRGTRGFRPSLSTFFRAALLGSITEDDLVREGLAQAARLQAAGITVTHLDTHKHTHILPLVTRALLCIANENKITAIRNPFEPAWSTALGHGDVVRRTSVSLLRASLRPSFQRILKNSPHIRTTDGSIGIAATGAVDQLVLEELRGALPSSGTWELVVHPGYPDADLDAIQTRLRSSRDVERQGLLATIPTHFQKRTPDLIHYGALAIHPG